MKKSLWDFINAILIVAIIGICFSAVINLMYSNANTPLALNGDTVWSMSFATGILDSLSYPKVVDKMVGPIGYPVPMLLFLRLVKQLPLNLFSVVFEMAYLFLPLFSLYLLILVCDLKKNRYRWIVAFFTFIVAWDYLQFDIRALNINIVLLCLVLLSIFCLQQGYQGWAGFLLALSVVVKLYSVFLILLWLYKKKYKAFFYFTVVSLILFVLIPAFCLGWGNAFALTIDWLEGVKSTSTAQAATLMSCYLVSFNRAVVAVAGATRETGISALSGVTWHFLNIILTVFKVFWAVFSIWTLYLIERRQKTDKIMRQVGVLLIMPLPMSPLLQPHHLVLILPALFILFKGVIIPHIRISYKLVSIFSGIFIFIFSQFIIINELYRGFIFVAISLLLMLGMIFIPSESDTEYEQRA